MSTDDILALTREGLSVVLWVSLPVVAVATLTALVVAMAQTVTQIQDQSIGQSLRLIAVLGATLVTAGWLGRQVLRFAERAMQMMAMPS